MYNSQWRICKETCILKHIVRGDCVALIPLKGELLDKAFTV
jgi:hypothetical protein